MRFQNDIGSTPVPANQTESSCHFSSLATDLASDEVFDLLSAFASDPDPNKVNLGAGVYRTNEGKPWPLPVVQRVEQAQYEAQDATRHEYLPIEGDVKFTELAADLIFKVENEQERSRIASIQTISGTGANHIGAMFLARSLKPKHVWISDPTWINHHSIWELAEIERRLYPYYNDSDRTFAFEAMIKTLENNAEPNDVVILHACAHNPTGIDPSKAQWAAIADVCRRKQLFPFFDCAYQGFASGDLDQDAWAIRYFFRAEPVFEMCVAQSFSKSLGLYGQRTGAFHLVCREGSVQTRDTVVAHLAHLVRSEFSMAPKFGASIARAVLESPQLMQEWMVDLRTMSDRIKICRQQLYEQLLALNTPGTWRHIVDQVN
jgi:aspartate aminotransferase